MKPRTSQTHALGFSLIEVLLAMFIVSVGLLGILALQTASVRSAADGRGRETAVYVCQTFLDGVQTEAQRLSLTTGYAIPKPTTAVDTYFGGAVAPVLAYFDANGNATTLANRVYTLAWARLAPRDAAPLCFEFSATTTWQETGANSALVTRTVQINRLVRID